MMDGMETTIRSSSSNIDDDSDDDDDAAALENDALNPGGGGSDDDLCINSFSTLFFCIELPPVTIVGVLSTTGEKGPLLLARGSMLW
jgi:hypothetical protein